MKTFYKYMFLSFCWLGAITIQAQTRIDLGKTNDLVATFKLKANTKALSGTTTNNKIRQTVPGRSPLVLSVNVTKKEGDADVFIGNVDGKKNSSFFLRAEGSNLSGYIILRDQKKAYQYSSNANGQALLQEVDIDKVICVDFKQNSAIKTDAPSRAATTAAAVPILESYPGAEAVVYLDFDGEYVSGTPWNGGNPINAAPSTLTTAEMEAVWKIMSEDFRPYALNITTNLAVFNSVPANSRMRVIFTPTTTAYPGSGGVAYIGSFNWNDNTPCWVFNTGAKGAGDTGSHEVGHTLKLGHDGRTSPAETYFYGQGSWAPIMGASFYSPQAQWSKGEYASANNTEDDLAIIATNGFGYRPDEFSRELTRDQFGNILPTAANNSGVITTRSDVDLFYFYTEGGNVTLNVNNSPNANDANLDVGLTLRNSSLTVIASANPASTTASISMNLAAGTYYLYVDGLTGSLGANTDYSSLGEYSISGFIPGYCVPLVANSCGSGDIINNFSFNTLANNNSDCNGQPNGYIRYNPTGTLTTQVSRGQTYNVSLQSGPTYAQGFGVWIDYNNDLDFGDAGEFVYSSPTAGTGVYNGTITIPASTSLGNKRMRVRSRYNDVFTSTQSCASISYGETEDYTITIVPPTTIWNVRYGGSAAETFAQVIKTTDGGYLLAGTSSSNISGDKSQAGQGSFDYWIVKTTSAGLKQWDKRFGGSAQDQLTTVIQTSDGGYLLGGRSYSGVSGDKSQAGRGSADFWIVKISSAGVKQWDKRFGGSGLDDLRKVVQLSTGEYVLAGYSDSPAGGDKTQASRGGLDYWVVKINSTGTTKIWDKRFGGSSTDFLATMVTTSDGFLLGGESASGSGGDKTQASQGLKDYWVVKINTSGNKVWDKRFGGSGDDFLNSIVPIAGNFLLAGESASGVSGDRTQGSYGGKDQWAVLINSVGTKLFDQRYGGSADDFLESAVATADGGYLLGGSSASGISGNKTQASQGSTDYWIVKTNSSGVKQWDKRYGGSAAENLNTVLALSDGYLLGGSSASGIGGDKTQASRGLGDYWLVKVSPTGDFAAPDAVEPVASASVSADETPAPTAARITAKPEEITPKLKLQAFPNPITERLQVNFSLPETQPVNLQIYDSQGQAVKTLFDGEAQANKSYEVEWRPQGDQGAGLYILHFRSKTETKQQKILYRK